MKRKAKKLPLSVYLGAAFLAFSALLLVVLWIFQTVFLDSFYKSIKTQQVKSCAYSLADYIDSSEFYNLIKDIEDQNSMSVSVYDTDTSIFSRVYTSDKALSFDSDISMSTVYDLYTQAQAQGGEYSTLTHVKQERNTKPDKIIFYSESNPNTPIDSFGTDDSTESTESTDSTNSTVGAVSITSQVITTGVNVVGTSGNSDTSNNTDNAADTNAGNQNGANASDANSAGNQDSANPATDQNGASGAENKDNSDGANNTNNAPDANGAGNMDGANPADQNGANGAGDTNPAPNSDSASHSDTNSTQSESEDCTESDTATDDEISLIIERHEPSLERETTELLSFAMIVDTTEGERLIVVQSEITPVNSVVETLRYQLIIMTIVIVVLSLVVAIIISKLISKPISEANDNAKSLAKQQYDITFEGGRYREITELNDTLTYATSELKKVDSLQKELIANISHDLRTPLTMITGYSEVMRDLPGEMTPENIQIIIDEATRLNSLVTDLLDISRLQSGTADVKKDPFSLTKCIESIFTRYTKLIENDGLNIVFEHDSEVFIIGDELRMTQVLYNLINNAINYIGADKTVVVRQSVKDERVTVEIIDHGEGIPEEKLKYIWDRYYRVDKEHKRAVIGTGLGLSIVKNILLAHGAEFGVASKLGEGSDFYFSLPIIPTDND